MTEVQCLITAAAIMLGTMATRFAPFVLLPKNRPVPKLVEYLGGTLPYAAMGLLVVYCLKDVDLTAHPFSLAEIIAVAVTALAHIWKRSTLLSIAVGTACYMILIRTAFPAL